MTWSEIRAHYAALHALARRAGATQKAIAERGGMSGQNSVSKLLKNAGLGPSVETFVRAVEGLGMTPSAFFAALEQGRAPASVDQSPIDRLHRIEQALDALASSLSSSSSASSPTADTHGSSSYRDRRPRVASPLSTGAISHPHTAGGVDLERVEEIVRSSTEGIVAKLEDLDARLAELGGRDEPVPASTPAPRNLHRR